MENYLLLKSLHLLGVVLFLGNITVTAVWKVLADRTRHPQTIAYSQRLVTITDLVFTAAGAVLIVVTGRLMAERHGGIDAASWITWGWWLFIVSGILWVLLLIPIQVMQARLAKQFALTNNIPEEYWVLSKWWGVVGLTATVLPLMNLYFMVFKPV